MPNADDPYGFRGMSAAIHTAGTEPRLLSAGPPVFMHVPQRYSVTNCPLPAYQLN